MPETANRFLWFLGSVFLVALVCGDVDGAERAVRNATLGFFKISDVVPKHERKLRIGTALFGVGNIQKLSKQILGELYVYVTVVLHFCVSASFGKLLA
jgi:hypothetical protein